MYERTYGYRYDRDRDVKDDAVMIRRDIKTLVAAGALPADWKYRVTIERFAGGRAINVTGISPQPIYLTPSGYVCAPKDAERLVRVPRPHNTSNAQSDEPWITLRLRAGEQHFMNWRDCVKPGALIVKEALQELLDSYNHDGSDIQSDYFDVKFYGHATVTTSNAVCEYDEPQIAYLAEGRS